MATKQIKLGPEATPSAADTWSAAKPVQLDGHGGTEGLSKGELTVTMPGRKQQNLALRATKDGDLLLEFDV
jgi:hypothetical protein